MSGYDIEWNCMYYALSHVSYDYWFIVTSNSYPQPEVSSHVEWGSLNYAFSYGVILAHSDINLIPTI